MTFDEFFRQATGGPPDPALVALARDDLPADVALPTGVDRSAVVLVWLWRRRHRQAPRRLIFALPRGSVLEPVADAIVRWLDATGMSERVAVHVVMGGAGEAERRWRLDPHRPAVVIGTAGALVSKALNRGHSLSRAMWPIDFALVTNGAHWVVDRPHLSPAATATLRRLVGFTRTWQTAEPFSVTCVSAAADLDGRAGTVPPPPPDGRELRREDLLAWFDTTDDVDLTAFVGGADAQVAWARWTPADASGRPAPEVRWPQQRWRRTVPFTALRAYAELVAVWWFDPAEGAWTRVTATSPLHPGDTVLVAAGPVHPDLTPLDPRAGLDPSDPVLVEPAPDVDPVPVPVAAPDPARWQSLERHSADVRDQVEALLAAIGPRLPGGAARAAAVAGHAHDLGKAHPTWQDALCGLAGDPEPDWVTAGRPWAKSGIDAPLRFRDDVTFRHELGSLLLLDGPLRGVLDGVDDPDLVRYLVLAHHGNLRMRLPPPEQAETVAVPALLGRPAGILTNGVPAQWTQTTTALLDRYGPFLLAYLETLVRIADWRASAGLPLAAR